MNYINNSSQELHNEQRTVVEIEVEVTNGASTLGNRRRRRRPFPSYELSVEAATSSQLQAKMPRSI